MPVSIKNRWSGEEIARVKDTDDLREAVIRLVRQGVSLREANLTRADLTLANLTPVRDDLYAVLSMAPAEVPALIAALDAGRVNGSTYSDGECGCLVGTLAIASGVLASEQSKCARVHDLIGQGSRPAELFFLAIKRGDTPGNSQFARLAHEWANQWLARMRVAFATKVEV